MLLQANMLIGHQKGGKGEAQTPIERLFDKKRLLFLLSVCNNRGTLEHQVQYKLWCVLSEACAILENRERNAHGNPGASTDMLFVTQTLLQRETS